jgi:hypothetical protein
MVASARSILTEVGRAAIPLRAAHPGRQENPDRGARQQPARTDQDPGLHQRHDIATLATSNSQPLVYELDAGLKPVRHYYLGRSAALL